MLSVIVAFPKIDDANRIRNILVRNGYEVALSCNNAAQVINLANKLEGGIVVCGYRACGQPYTDLYHYLPSGFSMMLLASPNKLVECYEEDILKVSMPLKINELMRAMESVMYIYRKKRKKENRPKIRTDEEKKVINEAKELLMSNNNMSEEQAHRYIQKISMDSGKQVVETAEMIIMLNS